MAIRTIPVIHISFPFCGYIPEGKRVGNIAMRLNAPSDPEDHLNGTIMGSGTSGMDQWMPKGSCQSCQHLRMNHGGWDSPDVGNF